MHLTRSYEGSKLIRQILSMHECIKKLMANVVTPEEEDIESLCRLLLTIGKQLDTPKTGEADKDYMSIYFMRLNTIVENKAVSSRLIFMILVCL